MFKNNKKIIIFKGTWIERKLRFWYAYIFPKKYAERIYLNLHHKEINWKNPEDYNQKIQWLKFYSDTSLWPKLADKYKVREYVTECGFDFMLNDLYAKYDSVEDIDISRLPDSFVLKANDRCGGVFKIYNKKDIDINDIKNQYKNIMKTKYGIMSGEPHYRKITPCIIAEKLLIDPLSNSDSLIDYKLHCFHGRVKYILVCLNRNASNDVDLLLYDMDWKIQYNCMSYVNSSALNIPRPKSLNLMIQAAEVLSKPFSAVRVDFYQINDKPLFGEITFTPAAGFINYYTDEFLKELGKYIELPK